MDYIFIDAQYYVQVQIEVSSSKIRASDAAELYHRSTAGSFFSFSSFSFPALTRTQLHLLQLEQHPNTYPSSP